MSLGRVALTEPPACRRVTSRVMWLLDCRLPHGSILVLHIVVAMSLDHAPTRTTHDAHPSLSTRGRSAALRARARCAPSRAATAPDSEASPQRCAQSCGIRPRTWPWLRTAGRSSDMWRVALIRPFTLAAMPPRVDELFVTSEYRERGIGRQLMGAFEAWALGRGCILVSLATRGAGPFYERLGYAATAEYFKKYLA